MIIREPPNPTVTTTEYWSQSYATTLTITAPPGGTNSVIIRVHSSTNDESSESTFSTLSVPSFSGSISIVSTVSRPHYVNSTVTHLPSSLSKPVDIPSSDVVTSTNDNSLTSLTGSENGKTSVAISTTFCDDENGCQTSIPQGSVVRTTATTTATTTTIIGDNNGSGKSKSGELSYWFCDN